MSEIKKISCSFGNIAYVHYLLDFTLPTIVFLHEGLGSISQWGDFPVDLGNLTKCNVLIFDRIGYGYSDGLPEKRTPFYLEEQGLEHVPEILTKLGVTKKLILFGHSDGGSIALIMPSSKIDLEIIGIITEAAHVFVEKETLDGITPAVNFYEKGKLKELLSKYHGDKTENIFYAWADTWRNKDYRNWNIEKYLSNITQPSLIIQGEEDQYGTVKQVESINSKTKGYSTNFLVKNCGHNPHKEKKDEVMALVIPFIQSILEKST